MASGTRRIKLAQHWHHAAGTMGPDGKAQQVYEYIVLSAVNTTTPNVGVKLTKEMVDELIMHGFETTIVPYKAS